MFQILPSLSTMILLNRSKIIFIESVELEELEKKVRVSPFWMSRKTKSWLKKY